MSEETETTDSGGSDFTPITSQDDLNKIIGERVKRAKPTDYDDLKAKASKFDQWEQSQKSEQERLQEQLSQLTSERDATTRRAERLEVIAAEGIPAEFHDLVHGDTPDALEASAKKVKALISAQAAKSSGPQVSYRVNLDGDGSDNLALNGDGLEQALKNKLGIN